MCDTRTLSSRNSVCVSHCTGCKSIYLWHNNVILNFTTEQFHSFKNLISNYDFDDGAAPFPDGAERIMVRMPEKGVSIAFMEEEWESLKEVLEEASYMREVYEMLG